MQATSQAVTLKGKPPLQWPKVRSIRVLGVNASKSRLAQGAVGGTLAGLAAGTMLALKAEGLGGELWGPAIVAAGFGGAYLGTHAASHRQDTLYILRIQADNAISDRVRDAGEQEILGYQ
jgi:hypothetical protein